MCSGRSLTHDERSESARDDPTILANCLEIINWPLGARVMLCEMMGGEALERLLPPTHTTGTGGTWGYGDERERRVRKTRAQDEKPSQQTTWTERQNAFSPLVGLGFDRQGIYRSLEGREGQPSKVTPRLNVWKKTQNTQIRSPELKWDGTKIVPWYSNSIWFSAKEIMLRYLTTYSENGDLQSRLEPVVDRVSGSVHNPSSVTPMPVIQFHRGR